MKSVQQVVNPLRVTKYSPPNIIISSSNSSYLEYTQFLAGTTQDYSRLFAYKLPNVLENLANEYDFKIMLESATQVVRLQSMSTTPVKVTVFWLRPKFDLYFGQSGSLGAVDPMSLKDLQLSQNNQTALSSSNYNFDIYTSEIMHYWSVIKRKTFNIMPGCFCDVSQVLRRKILTYRRCVGGALTNPPSYSKSTRCMLLQFSAAQYGSDTSGVTSAPSVTVSCVSNETYHWRPMLDTRPVYDISGSSLGQGTTAVTEVNQLDEQGQQASNIAVSS